MTLAVVKGPHSFFLLRRFGFSETFDSEHPQSIRATDILENSLVLTHTVAQNLLVQKKLFCARRKRRKVRMAMGKQKNECALVTGICRFCSSVYLSRVLFPQVYGSALNVLAIIERRPRWKGLIRIF